MGDAVRIHCILQYLIQLCRASGRSCKNDCRIGELKRLDDTECCGRLARAGTAGQDHDLMLNGCPDRPHLDLIILHSGHSGDTVFKVAAVNQKADRCSADLVQAFGCACLGIAKRRKVDDELMLASFDIASIEQPR